MPPKLRHACERCGLEAVFERAGRFRDEDYHGLLQEHFALERDLAKALVRLHFTESRLTVARERIAQLQELVNAAPDPEPEIEAADDKWESPF